MTRKIGIWSCWNMKLWHQILVFLESLRKVWFPLLKPSQHRPPAEVLARVVCKVLPKCQPRKACKAMKRCQRLCSGAKKYDSSEALEHLVSSISEEKAEQELVRFVYVRDREVSSKRRHSKTSLSRVLFAVDSSCALWTSLVAQC